MVICQSSSNLRVHGLNDTAVVELARRYYDVIRKTDIPTPSFNLHNGRFGYAIALRVDHGVSANRPHMFTG